jgi:hypothetical protein
VFVYDDKVVLTFNYSGDDRTITLHEIDGGLGHSICIPSCVVHQKKKAILSDGFSFFVDSYGIEETGRAERGKEQSGGLFLRSGEIPFLSGRGWYSHRRTKT